MVDKALIFLQQQVNAYLKSELGGPDALITLTNVVNQDGTTGVEVDSLGMTLVNIEEEFAMQPMREFVKSGQNDVRAINPGLYVNLYLLISANYKKYLSALKSLTRVLLFFQANHTFRSETSPGLEAIGIDQLQIKVHKSSFEAQNQLWGTLGAKYIPSVVYKLRMVQVQSGQLGTEIPLVKSLDTKLSNH